MTLLRRHTGHRGGGETFRSHWVQTGSQLQQWRREQSQMLRDLFVLTAQKWFGRTACVWKTRRRNVIYLMAVICSSDGYSHTFSFHEVQHWVKIHLVTVSFVLICVLMFSWWTWSNFISLSLSLFFDVNMSSFTSLSCNPLSAKW